MKEIKRTEAKKPTEGKLFKVNPKAIDQGLFKETKNNSRHEWTRQLILEAFEEVKKNPKKYAEEFETLIPKKTWLFKMDKELEEEAIRLGGYNGDWVEQALEWAQRISNGEEWTEICDKPDTAEWYRLVKWKNGCYKLVGGSSANGAYGCFSASDVHGYDSLNLSCYFDTVPLVVLRK